MFEIGSSLREARLRQGIGFPEAEQGTKVRSKYLRALEEEQFDVLPAETYVRGFLRAYAEFLGLDGQLYVDEYNSRYTLGDEDSPAEPGRRRSRSTARPRIQSRVVVFTVLAIAAVTALVIVAWKGGAAKKPQLQPTVPAVTRRKPKATVPSHSAVPSAVLMVKTSSGSSQVTILNGSAAGKQRFAGTVDPTHPEFLRFRGRVWLQASAPANLLVKVNGTTLPLPPSTPAMLYVSTKAIRPATS